MAACSATGEWWSRCMLGADKTSFYFSNLQISYIFPCRHLLPKLCNIVLHRCQNCKNSFDKFLSSGCIDNPCSNPARRRGLGQAGCSDWLLDSNLNLNLTTLHTCAADDPSVSQSRRRPLLGPPVWKCQLPTSAFTFKTLKMGVDPKVSRHEIGMPTQLPSGTGGYKTLC